MPALAGFLLIALGPLAFRYGLVSADVGLGAVALGVLLAVTSVGAALVAWRRAVSDGRPRTMAPSVLLAAIALVTPAWSVARVWTAPAAFAGDAGFGVLILTGDPLQTFGRAGRAAQEMGWTVVEVDEAGGRILAADTSRWFRLTDDVEIRVRPEGDRDQVRVDIRVTARTPVGQPWRALLRLDPRGVDGRRTADYFTRLASLR